MQHFNLNNEKYYVNKESNNIKTYILLVKKIKNVQLNIHILLSKNIKNI